ncbi:MAG: 3-hydroxyacyl-ACP dehydratase FabZ [Synergistaceae bacterium]|nr:3-hydroxyacyl-ACP dehydratase FabZ [Synergistaceae bacterium]
MDVMEIMKILHHRYPFLMVDRILEYSKEYVVGYKNVTINEPFFQGHFPGDPVMPGVLTLESMGQVASILAMANLGDRLEGQVVFLTGVEKARFRKPIRPGDRLVTKAELVRVRGSAGKAKVTGYVDDVLVSEGLFSFVVASTLDKNASPEED